MPTQSPILLSTKLHRPHPPADLIQRTRLMDFLTREISHPLTLVCAPAGFGKSTLVSSWFERLESGTGKNQEGIAHAWLSLDEKDSDPNLFMTYFIAALRTAFGESCKETLSLLQAQQPPPKDVLNSIFINELDRLPGELILALDDYHLIQGSSVHELLGEMVRHWPQNLHMVLISRMSPPLPLSTLRAHGMVTEIRTRDLRFTSEETWAYLNLDSSLVDKDTLPLFEHNLEGWPAGLHLATLSLRSTNNRDSVFALLSGENSDIASYLVDEVLDRQIPPIHSFLLHTSVLERFSASLCEAVLGDFDPDWNARACLDYIERSGLFLIPLDDRREWYRYHHFFQGLLQQRLTNVISPEEKRGLYLRASTWFENRKMFDDAIQYALFAGDHKQMAVLMGAGLPEAINHEDRPTLERWLKLLPEEEVWNDPGLLMVKAWTEQNLWWVDLQAVTLKRASELIGKESGFKIPPVERKILLGQIQVLQSQWAYFSNCNREAIELSRQSLENLPTSWKYARGGAMFYMSLAMQAEGRIEEAKKILLDEYESYGDKDDSYSQLLLLSLGWQYLKTGQLERVKQIAGLLIQPESEDQIAINKSLANSFRSAADFHQNDLESASDHFLRIIENRYFAHISTYRDAVAGMALIFLRKGEHEKAWHLYNSISLFDLEQKGIEDERTRSLRARMLLMQGEVEEAGAWVDTLKGPPPDISLTWLEEPQITRVRVLLERGTEDDLANAERILLALEEIVDRTHNILFKVAVSGMQAVLLQKQGEPSRADPILRQAIDLARPGGIIRFFIDLGEPMKKMITRICDQGYSTEFCRRILAAFSAEDLLRKKGSVPSGNDSLPEPLTPRELEVLDLLAGPQSVKEIAAQLHISYATAKRHIINIYAKLDVDQRRKAVAAAKECGILAFH